jgi:diguanylate cyclase (GGDEF)-like protein
MQRLETLNREYLVYTEYLDWKRSPTQKNLDIMYDLCRNKYEGKKIDLIITTDDEALRFALEHRKALFSDAPIVFGGVYRESAATMLQGRNRVTGAYQDMNIEATIKCAVRINPKINRAYVLNEETVTGMQTEELSRRAIARLLPNIPIYSLSDHTLEEIEAIVPTLDQNSLFIIGSYSIEKNGLTFTTEKLVARISKVSSVPVYPIFAHTFGGGAIGGVMISGILHGENAGTLAVRYLDGESFDTLSPIGESSYVTAFDYSALKRFGIPLWSLPKGAKIINRDPPFFIRYKAESLFIVAIFILLVGAVQMLLLLNRQSRDLALTDQLTGLPNRSAVLRIAERMIRSTERWNKCGVMFIDIDNFKFINDTFGHETGDQVLLYVSETLRSILTDNMKIARFGGDEFLIILENTSYDRIEAFAQYLHATLANKAVISGAELYLTISSGISVYPDHGLHFSELYKNADAAMFKAKSAGKTRFMFYNNSMYQELKRRMDLEAAMHTAIANGEFSVIYQPKINLRNGYLDSVETLVRWTSPKEGSVSPTEFIPIAEDNGQIVEIGLFVMRSAARFVKKASAFHEGDFTVSVNVSVRQLNSPGFLRELIDIVRDEGVEPNQLSLEITESILIESVREIAETLKILREAGFGLSLDDFGKGYSSLTYLRRLPVNEVKMDKAFIDDMFEDERSRSFTISIIRICHDLSLKVVAEGVETREQVDFLLAHGCDFIQGYYFSKPEPEDHILSIMNRKFLSGGEA